MILHFLFNQLQSSSVARHLKVGGQSKIEATVPTKYSWCTDLRPTKRLAMRKYLEEVDVKSIIDAERSCERKTQMLESTSD